MTTADKWFIGTGFGVVCAVIFCGLVTACNLIWKAIRWWFNRRDERRSLATAKAGVMAAIADREATIAAEVERAVKHFEEMT